MDLRPDGTALTAAAHDALDALRDMAQARKDSSTAVALAWIIGHPDCVQPRWRDRRARRPTWGMCPKRFRFRSPAASAIS